MKDFVKKIKDKYKKKGEKIEEKVENGSSQNEKVHSEKDDKNEVIISHFILIQEEESKSENKGKRYTKDIIDRKSFS